MGVEIGLFGMVLPLYANDSSKRKSNKKPECFLKNHTELSTLVL